MEGTPGVMFIKIYYPHPSGILVSLKSPEDIVIESAEMNHSEYELTPFWKTPF